MAALPPLDPPPARPPALASSLALDTCRLIGANPAGPVGARLIDACGHLPPGAALASGAERDALVARRPGAASTDRTRGSGRSLP